jgi:hypothetical protein
MVKRSTLIVSLAGVLLAGCGSSSSSSGTGGSGGEETGGAGGATGGKTGTGGGGGATGGSSGSTGGSGGSTGGAGGATGGAGGSTGGAGGSTGGSGGATGGAGGGGMGGMGAASPKMSFFITSETSMTGNLGGLAMADAKCARLAMAAGVTGKTWKAYLSTMTEAARTRIGTGPWFNFKGEMIAMNLEQLHEENGMKNGLTQATNLTDKGSIVSGRTMQLPGESNQHDILTGSTRAGMLAMGANCGDWTSTMGNSTVGHSDRMGTQTDPAVAASWNSAHTGQCANTTPGGGAGRFYCFATN